MATNKQYEKAESLTDVDDTGGGGEKRGWIYNLRKVAVNIAYYLQLSQQSGRETSTRMKRKLFALPDLTGGGARIIEALVINEADRQKNYHQGIHISLFPIRKHGGSLQFVWYGIFFFFFFPPDLGGKRIFLNRIAEITPSNNMS
jgi:hypothetical protein